MVATWGFSDSWVLGYTAIAILFLLFVPLSAMGFFAGVGLVLGALRILEIIGYLFKVLLIDDSDKNLSERIPPVLSSRRLLVLALHNYLEIVLWFAFAYAVFEERFQNSSEILTSSVGSFYFSVVTMTTLGYGDVTPRDSLTRLLVTSQTLLGVFMALVVVGWMVGLLPRRESIER